MEQELYLNNLEKNCLKDNIHYFYEGNYSKFWNSITQYPSVLKEGYITPYKIYLFIKCNTGVNLLEKLKCIPPYFGIDSELESIKIPEYIEKIDETAFFHSKNLIYVEFNDKITTIPKAAFMNCNNPLFFYIDLKNVEKIEHLAFCNCNNLWKFNWNLDQNSKIEIENGAFDNISKHVEFDVTCSASKIYDTLLDKPKKFFTVGTQIKINCHGTGEILQYEV